MCHKEPALTGVNLGGWLVIEKWITPSLFKDSSVADEYDLHLNIGSDLPKLHYESFITDSDFR